MDEIEVTSKQLRDMDEIVYEEQAIEGTMRVALQFHTNQMTRLAQRNKEWWEDIRESHKLDSTKKYFMDSSGPRVLIKEKKNE